MKREWLKTIAKGLWVGSTMTVPGVSGGTMAVVVGIYEKLIHTINAFKGNPKAQIPFLMQFMLGAGVGFLVFARIVTVLLEHTLFGSLTRLFFCGVVLGGVPLLVCKSGIKKLEVRHIVSLFLGAMIVLGISTLPEGVFSSGTGILSWILQFVAGFVVAIALILPGISVTHILYIMGLYEVLVQRIYALQIFALLPFVIGGIVGTFLTADLLERGMQRFPEEIYMIIVGFVSASLFRLLPTTASSIPFPGAFVAVAGFMGMYVITRQTSEMEPTKNQKNV